jgi:DNA polymerase III epsilon subunit-like protein
MTQERAPITPAPVPTLKDFVGPHVFLDTETSNSVIAIKENYDYDMVQIAFCTVDFDTIMDRRISVKFRVQRTYNTNLELNQEVLSGCTGITKEVISICKFFSKVDATYLNKVLRNRTIWAHNAAFDMMVIDRAFAKVNVKR